jgi:FKBP-type peptidyl-prolyl cis-trans isomerase
MNKLLYLSLLVFIFSCQSEAEKEKQVDWDQTKSTEFNKSITVEEEINIDLYLEEHKDWKVTKSGSGLRYWIYKEGDGPIATSSKNAEVEIIVQLLDGTECYRTDADEVEVFEIDHADIESGIHEGIKLMHVGDRAKLIIPSHLAHGLVGDLDKVPPMSTLVVDIHLIGLEE